MPCGHATPPPGGQTVRMSDPTPPAPSHVAGTSATRLHHGLVIGTFYPPHAGHLALIRAALSRCDVVTVEVLGGSTESIAVTLRLDWLREEAPTARIVGVVDDAEIDFESGAAWDHHTGVIRSLLDPADGAVEGVFTSDAYGEELARRLGAQWVRVDPDRSSLTVSSTAVRANVAAQWWALPAPVRAWLARRVDVVDPDVGRGERRGRLLADALGVPCVVGGDDDHAVRRSPRPLVVRCGPPPTGPAGSAQAAPLTLGVDPGEDDGAWLAASVVEVADLLADGFGLVPSLEQQQAAARRDAPS